MPTTLGPPLSAPVEIGGYAGMRPHRPRPRVPGAPPRAARRVLVADDDGDQRLLVEIAVRRAGCDAVRAVPDGVTALEVARSWLPDLVVLDVAMPGMTGTDVCAALRADPRTARIRLLLVTAAVHPSSVRAGAAAGADGYVAKPFRVRDLSSRVGALLAV